MVFNFKYKICSQMVIMSAVSDDVKTITLYTTHKHMTKKE
jgi:hypothetical protein